MYCSMFGRKALHVNITNIYFSAPIQNTAVSGPRGLAVGDPVTSIGGCQVTSIRDWNGCLAQSMREPSCGNCVPVSMITELDTARKAKIGKFDSVN